MGTIIFSTIMMVALLGIVHRALGHIGVKRLQYPLMILIMSVPLLSMSVCLSSPMYANILRTVIGVVIILWMIYTFIASQIEPGRDHRSNLELSPEQEKKVRALADEVMRQSKGDFGDEVPSSAEGDDLDAKDLGERKPGKKPSGITPKDMIPLPIGTGVHTPEGDGVIDVFIPTLEMVHKTEEYRDVRGYRVRMDDNNIRYFRMSDVQELLK